MTSEDIRWLQRFDNFQRALLVLFHPAFSALNERFTALAAASP